MPSAIENFEKLLGTPRDGALLRYSLGLEYAKAGDRERAIAQLREAVARDALYSAAWRALGRALADAGRDAEALDAYRQGIAAAQKRGDKQAEKEMSVFAKRLARATGGEPPPNP
jgi:predicted Zn-dependent protease